MRKLIIDDAIITAHPGFYRAVLIVCQADNAEENPALSKMLAEAASTRIGMDVKVHPAVRAWDDAHIKCGLNPNKYPPSVKALLKRVAGGHAIPFVNTAVALFNIISIKGIIPCGGDDVDKISGDLVLGIADGSETFIPLGQPDKSERPDPGEVIYFDSGNKKVMCRRWNWRNGDCTKLQPSTRNMVINIDCIPPISRADADQSRDELAALLASHCNAQVSVDFLDQKRQQISLPTL
jgi:lysyl-tRNA synthetase class 2